MKKKFIFISIKIEIFDFILCISYNYKILNKKHLS